MTEDAFFKWYKCQTILLDVITSKNIENDCWWIFVARLLKELDNFHRVARYYPLKMTYLDHEFLKLKSKVPLDYSNSPLTDLTPKKSPNFLSLYFPAIQDVWT